MAVTINIVSRLDDYAMKQAQAQMLALGKAAIRSDASMSGAFLRTGANLTALGGKMKTTGSAMSMYVTLPLVAIGYESVKSAMKFQSSMALIKTQAGGTAKDVKTLSAAILGMKNVQYGPNELATAMYHLKSVGMDNTNAMAALRVASEGAAVGQSDLEDTTSALAAAWKTGILGAGTFTGAMGEVNAIVGAGNMRMSDLVSAMGTGFLLQAKLFGVSLQSVGSALDILVDRGLPATRAATGLRMAITMMGAPTAKATGILKTMGLGQFSLARDLLKPDGLVLAIGALKDHLEGVSQVKADADLSGMFGVRSGTAIMGLIENLTGLKKKYQEVGKTAHDFKSEVDTQAKTVSAEWATAKASIKTAAVLIGNDLMPDVVWAAKEIDKLAGAFDHLSPGWRKFIIEAGVAAAALGPLFYGLGTMLKVGGSVSTALGMIMLKMNMASAGGGASKLGSGINAILGRGGAAGAGAGTAEVSAAGGGVAAGLPVVIIGASAAAAAVIGGALVLALSNRANKLNTSATALARQSTPGPGGRSAGSSLLNNPSLGTSDVISAAIGIVNSRTATTAAQGNAIAAELDALHKLAAKPLILGDINGTHSVASLIMTRDKLEKSLHLTASQANDIMNMMFKDWNPSKELSPKMVAADNLLQSFVKKFKQEGLNLTGGLALGVLEGSPHAINVVTSLATGMSTQFAEQVDSNSPSKVFAKQGLYITQGLTQGIEHGAKGPIGAIGRLGAQLARKLSGYESKMARVNAGSSFANLSGGSGGGGTSSANEALGQKMAASVGWTGAQWSALAQLWTRESGWNNTAQNPTSTAYGIAQFLNSTWSSYGAKTSDPRTQIKYGMEYIKNSYRTPLSALDHENRVGWYDRGGQWPSGTIGINTSGHTETVLPPGKSVGNVYNVNIQMPPGMLVSNYRDAARQMTPVLKVALRKIAEEERKLT